MTVGSAGGPLKGAVAVDSTEATGGAGGVDASEVGATGGVLTGTPGVPHTVSVTVTVTGATQAARAHVRLGYTESMVRTHYLGEYRERRQRRRAQRQQRS